MEYTKRFIYQSNQWYNDGLKKANIRDMSGAIASLKKSLQYNRDNIAARNLLGLVYYGRGEVVEALVEWVISKNIKTHGNIANYYIKKVQETQSELEAINQAIKKYNQCLVYCQQGGEDLAAIQLKKVIAAHPTFLKAHQLLALLYIQTEQYAKARQLIRKAHKLDTTNETTLRYMHELKQLHKDKAAKLREDKVQTVSYNLGNEMIIQPVSATLKDNATIMTILNIVIGLVVGAAVVWFLAVPALKQNMSAKTNKEIIVYSEQIAALESEIDLMQGELDVYAEESQVTAAEKEKAKATTASYEALVQVIEHYQQEGYKRSTLVDEILAVNTASLGETGKNIFDKISKEVYEAECAELWEKANTSYLANGFKRAVEHLERIMQMNEKYADGQAMLLLMQTYDKQGETEKADVKYKRILELFPDTQVAKDATAFMTEETE